MDNIVFEKAVMTVLLVLWPWAFWGMFRKWQKKTDTDSVIAEADSREQYKWRHVRWGWRIMQILCQLYLLWVVVRFILS